MAAARASRGHVSRERHRLRDRAASSRGPAQTPCEAPAALWPCAPASSPGLRGTLRARRSIRASSWPARLRTMESSGERSSVGTRSRTSVDIRLLRSRRQQARAAPRRGGEQAIRAVHFWSVWRLHRGAPALAEEPPEVVGRPNTAAGLGWPHVDLDPLRRGAAEFEAADLGAGAAHRDRAEGRGQRRVPGREIEAPLAPPSAGRGCRSAAESAARSKRRIGRSEAIGSRPPARPRATRAPRPSGSLQDSPAGSAIRTLGSGSVYWRLRPRSGEIRSTPSGPRLARNGKKRRSVNGATNGPFRGKRLDQRPPVPSPALGERGRPRGPRRRPRRAHASTRATASDRRLMAGASSAARSEAPDEARMHRDHPQVVPEVAEMGDAAPLPGDVPARRLQVYRGVPRPGEPDRHLGVEVVAPAPARASERADKRRERVHPEPKEGIGGPLARCLQTDERRR